MSKKKFDIRDYAEDLQELCGGFKACKRCMKRGRNIASHLCITKRYAFSLAKIYVLAKQQVQKKESED